jgi:uncharacterized protein (TIGR00299 family) protein
MKLVYFDCASGISGDMTLGALVDLGVDLEQLNAAIASLGLPDCRLTTVEVRKNGFRAVQVTVEYPPEHKHRHLHHILEMIRGSSLTPRQQELAARIFTRLGEAEAKVHGVAVEKVHFHEVGAADSIADIVGTAVGLDLLGVERIVASPVPTGTGKIRIAHGECSIPAPATAELLRGIPLATSHVEAELTTPTGAAILAALADEFGPPPAMTIQRIGCGAGQRELEGQPNLLRLLLGVSAPSGPGDQVWVVETNLDDTSGELIGHCTTLLWDAKPLDVYLTPIQMKKNRPGVKITVLCRAAEIEPIEEILFRETGTLGVRRWPASRRVLARQTHRVATSWGPVEGKVAWLPGGVARFSPEFEACRRIAVEQGMSLQAVYEAAQQAFDPCEVRHDVDC